MNDHWNKGHQIDYACGWRFLFSSRFRQEVKAKWGGSIWLGSMCLAGGLIGIGITTAIIIILVMGLWEIFTL